MAIQNATLSGPRLVSALLCLQCLRVAGNVTGCPIERVHLLDDWASKNRCAHEGHVCWGSCGTKNAF